LAKWFYKAVIMSERAKSRHVFLSYSRKDAAFMRRVCDDLRAEGLIVWTDETGLEPGTPDWEDAIDEALEQAGCMVVLLSPDAKESRWVGIETARAEARGTPIIPVLLHGDPLDAVPLRLTNYQRVDAREDYRSAAEHLVRAVCDHMGVEPLSVQRDRAAREEARRRREEAERLRPAAAPVQKAAPAASRPAAYPAQPTAKKRSLLASPLVWIGCAGLAIILCAVLMAAVGGPLVRWLAGLWNPPSGPPTPHTIPSQELPPPTEWTEGLDRNLPPNYGEVGLASGFLPDPASAPITAGGSVPAGDSMPECRGYVTSAPDLNLYWNGSGSRLRLFFVPDGATDDTTLVVSTPNGDWLCNDDTYGLNPGIDIDGAPSGVYAIWVGSYMPEQFIPGTLYFTERDIGPEDVP
jgi:hypothetical protein